MSRRLGLNPISLCMPIWHVHSHITAISDIFKQLAIQLCVHRSYLGLLSRLSRVVLQLGWFGKVRIKQVLV